MIQKARTFVTSDGCRYFVDKHGVGHQEDAKPFVYDEAYVSTYATPAYHEKSLALSCLRLGWVTGLFQSAVTLFPGRLLDVGYGDGSFMREAKKLMPVVHGKDVSPVPVPDRCLRVDDFSEMYDIVTFWDSLEHHADLSFVSSIDARMVAVSLPWCHELGTPWFDNWKHRKPNEHVHHFSHDALLRFMAASGWRRILAVDNHEDIIRIPSDGKSNILSMAFMRE